jgi:hypothetical protein
VIRESSSVIFSASNRAQHVRYRTAVEDAPDDERDDQATSWQYGLSAEAHPFSGPLCAWPARRGGRCSAAPDSGG